MKTPWTLEIILWKNTLCSSCFIPLGILHSPLWDMYYQHKHISSTSCLLMSWPMFFPRISSSHRQVFPLLKVTLHTRKWPGPTQYHRPEFCFPPQGPFKVYFSFSVMTAPQNTDRQYHVQGRQHIFCSWPIMFCNASTSSEENMTW